MSILRIHQDESDVMTIARLMLLLMPVLACLLPLI